MVVEEKMTKERFIQLVEDGHGLTTAILAIADILERVEKLEEK